MTFDELFIRTKLRALKGYIKEIEHFLRYSDKEIFENSEKIHIGERVFQLAVDAMIDINQHIIKEKKLKVVEDLQGTFYVLAESKVLPESFSNKIAGVVGVRNRIVHGYETLDKKLFMANLRKHHSDFTTYITLIDEYLKKIK